MSSGDFVRLQDPPKHAEEWADEETLLLLEGIEMYDEDWLKVAQHVGTRSREQCILKFLQLPIEDPYLGTSIKELGPLQYDHVPFNQTDNPVMSIVAFLASVVNPGVASAAAQAALKELTTPTPQENRDVEMTDADPATQESVAVNSLQAPGVSNIQKAATAAIAAAAQKAHALVEFEERGMQRLVNAVIETQLKKMELKLQQFEQLEALLDHERKEIEKQRQQLVADKLALSKSMASFQHGHAANQNTAYSDATIVKQSTQEPTAPTPNTCGDVVFTQLP
jgi:SWI/SNF related-matrix-associated actin-dependent regulator of chromatin subfamily C